MMAATPMVRRATAWERVWFKAGEQMWRTWPLDDAVRGTDDAPEGGDSKDAAEQPRGGTTRLPAHRTVHSPVMHGAMISVES